MSIETIMLYIGLLCLSFYFLQGIADTMAYLQKEGRLLRAEHNLLGEAFLVMASASG